MAYLASGRLLRRISLPAALERKEREDGREGEKVEHAAGLLEWKKVEHAAGLLEWKKVEHAAGLLEWKEGKERNTES